MIVSPFDRSLWLLPTKLDSVIYRCGNDYRAISSLLDLVQTRSWLAIAKHHFELRILFQFSLV